MLIRAGLGLMMAMANENAAIAVGLSGGKYQPLIGRRDGLS